MHKTLIEKLAEEKRAKRLWRRVVWIIFVLALIFHLAEGEWLPMDIWIRSFGGAYLMGLALEWNARRVKLKAQRLAEDMEDES